MGETGAFIAAALAAYGPDWIRKPIESVKEFLKFATEAKAVEFQKIALNLDKQLMEAEKQASIQEQRNREQEFRIKELEKCWDLKTKSEPTEYGCYLLPGDPIPFCGTCLDDAKKLMRVARTGLKLTCGRCKNEYSLPGKGPGRIQTPYQ